MEYHKRINRGFGRIM